MSTPAAQSQPSEGSEGRPLKGLALKVVRFAMTGAIATGINIGLYLLLVNRVLPPVAANLVAYSSSVVINFMLQKRYVFQLERSAGRAFTLSMLASVGGLLLDTGIVATLNLWPFFAERQWLIKFCSTGVVFIYNFISKRYIFEKRLS